MDQAQYFALIQRAHHDEVMTAIALDRVLAVKAEDAPDYRALRLMHRLESETGDVMAHLMRRYELPEPDADAIAAEGEAMAAGLHEWAQTMEILRGLLPDVVATYDDLATKAKPGDEAILDYFARHERAILDLANAELEGQAARNRALAAIEAVLETRPV